MQQFGNNQILYSPTDLITFLGCPHASFLDFKALSEFSRVEPDATSLLLQKKGMEHEINTLELLKQEGKSVIEIPKGFDLEARAKKTLEAIHSGADVIYQAVFFDLPWRGDADFLLKTPKPSSLGNFSYEVLDTKLALRASPSYIIQLCMYSDFLTRLQNYQPAEIHIFSGGNEKLSFRLFDFWYYYLRIKKKFENHMEQISQGIFFDECPYFNLCQPCKERNPSYDSEDHLSSVANIQRSQINKFAKANIHSLNDLANSDIATQVPDLNRDIFLRLRSQAILQHHKNTTGKNKWEIIPQVSQYEKVKKGFSRLPKPNEGDLFFDMEGDPLYPDGLEYLFGVYYLKNGEPTFRSFWAHDHKEEKKTFREFMRFLDQHLNKNPSAYIYHYNHYETTALKRLACRYGVCEEQLDNLLRAEKFVDLYLVVRESIRTSESGYSIKNLETFYMKKRNDEVSTAMDSILVYNEWREGGRPPELLKQIAKYNEVDCISTYELQKWLLSLKPANIPFFENLEKKTEEISRKDWEIEYEKYQNFLGVDENNPDPTNEKIAHLLEYHNRETKVEWWKTFERQDKFQDELINDAECLGGLQQVGDPIPEKRSLLYTYIFPDQETKLKVGDSVVNITTLEKIEPIGIIFEIENNRISIKRSATKPPLPQNLSIGPTGPIDSKILRAAIYRYADYILEKKGEEQKKSHPVTELLQRALPNIQGKKLNTLVIDPESNNLQKDALEAVLGLKNSYLFIQGPPGAGKTYTSSHIIAELIRHKKKIGVTSNSHKAIHNLLQKIEQVALEKNIQFWGIKKSSAQNEESRYQSQFIESQNSTRRISLKADLFAGTAWTFSNEYFEDQLDYLFIDEAGQVPLANVVAMGMSTKNIILVGDQMQLSQPVQGTHPGEAGLSVLDFLLKDHATIPPERGIFLGQSRRMRPSICDFISSAFYDARLIPHESTKERNLHLDPPNPNEGIIFIPAEHENCSQKSMEEGEIIQKNYQALLGKKYSTATETRTITEQDILVLSPYNVQVNYLRTILPPNAKVGTVDKFQGQEVPIVLISMATSSAEDLPRNIEFLYSRNRINVALSRAQCLAIWVANPNLLEIYCNSLEKIKLVNTFCWLEKYSKKKFDL